MVLVVMQWRSVTCLPCLPAYVLPTCPPACLPALPKFVWSSACHILGRTDTHPFGFRRTTAMAMRTPRRSAPLSGARGQSGGRLESRHPQMLRLRKGTRSVLRDTHSSTVSETSSLSTNP